LAGERRRREEEGKRDGQVERSESIWEVHLYLLTFMEPTISDLRMR